MPRYGWRPYVSVAKRKAKATRHVERLRKQGKTVCPVEIQGRKIATTFWGKGWCDTLESFSDYDNRLPRGRTYARNGSVIDVQINPGHVKALVSGSSIYTVNVTVAPTPKPLWQAAVARCAGKIDSVVELLSGRLSQGVMEVLATTQGGLFPTHSEIRTTCSCPDYATLCKHIAAVLYGIGARLDHEPELLFTLRQVEPLDLITAVETTTLAQPTDPTNQLLADDDLSALFGIDLDDEPAQVPQPEPKPVKPKLVKPKPKPRIARPKPAKPKTPAQPHPEASEPNQSACLLETLTRPTLLRLCETFALPRSPGYLTHAALVDFLASAPTVIPSAVLSQLRLAELKRACSQLNLPSTARRKADFVARLVAALSD